ncbi:hypothetical protein AB0G85_37280 [Streptomyces sioyaensis]|uniref:hypothetical protein n=1 Tax=Streptomyces sioyaensis TaxID=67364 RepID=UPI0033EB46FC
MTDEESVLERAVAQLRVAEAAVIEARTALSAVIVAEHRAGVPVADLAARTGKSATGIRNLLDAAGV